MLFTQWLCSSLWLIAGILFAGWSPVTLLDSDMSEPFRLKEPIRFSPAKQERGGKLGVNIHGLAELEMRSSL